jgi:hypothetical protein
MKETQRYSCYVQQVVQQQLRAVEDNAQLVHHIGHHLPRAVDSCVEHRCLQLLVLCEQK